MLPPIDSPALNPFFHRGPVRDPAYFFGRRREAAYLADLLLQGQSVAISGPRRIGKTSLLFHISISISISISRPRLSEQPASPFHWVYLDGGALDGLDEEWFYGAVDRALGGEAEAVPYARFVERLRGLAAQGERLVLLLDEFELIAANPRLGPAVFHHLRGLAAQYPLQFVTASRDPLLQLTFAHRETLSSPFFNIFAPLRLQLLDLDDARELLTELSTRAGQPLAADTVDFLIGLAGPHPLFLQVAGYRAFALAGEGGSLTPEARRQVQTQMEADLEPHLQYAWAGLDAEARHALAVLPLLDFAARPPALERAQAAGLLHAGAYLGRLLEDFVRRQSVEGLLQAGPFLMDLRRGLAAALGRPVHLTPTEFACLRLFLERPGILFTPDELEAALWPGQAAADSERARGVVKKLRAALGPAGEAIVNRRGQGYLLATD